GAAGADGCDAALTVGEVPLRYHPLKQLRLDREGNLCHHTEDGARIVNRQELTPTYVRNGQCYAVRTTALSAGHGILGANPRAFIVEGPIVNIDDAEDLALARRLIGGCPSSEQASEP